MLWSRRAHPPHTTRFTPQVNKMQADHLRRASAILVILVMAAANQPLLHAAAPAPELSAAEVNSLRAAAEAPSLSSGSAGGNLRAMDELFLGLAAAPAQAQDTSVLTSLSAAQLSQEAFGPSHPNASLAAAPTPAAPVISTAEFLSTSALAPAPGTSPGNQAVLLAALTAFLGSAQTARQLVNNQSRAGSLGPASVDNMRTLLGTLGSPLQGLNGHVDFTGVTVSSLVATQGLNTVNLPFTKIAVSGRYLSSDRTMVAFNGDAVPATSTISISAGSSSWAADTYTIPNNTNIILESGVLRFTILAKTLVVGSGVTFTWQPTAAKAVPAQSLGSLQVPPAPPGLPPVSSSAPLDLRGNAQFAGTQGSPGKTGNGGFQGDSGPTLTLIYEALKMQTAHPPTFVLSGQQGQTGGQGGTGGSGGKGPQGTPAQASTVPPFGIPDGCSRNVGYGGNGGPGGIGGTGGPGGAGGSNGELAIFSSAANLQQLGVTPLPLYSDVGLGGAGGLGGQGGSGGTGGDPGPNDVTFCPTINGRTGNPGQTGATGASGLTASKGTRVLNYQPQLLDSQQVQDCFAAPRITSVSPSVVLPGSLLTLFGSNFATGQNVTFAGKTLDPTLVTVPTTTQMTIEVPTNLAGPSASISIGNLSALCQTSQASVLIGLRLTSVQQAGVGSVNMPGPGSVLFQPGSVATARGDGFGPNMTVIINSTILGGAQVTVDTTDHSITFTMTRPGSFDKYDASNKWGETVSITVAHQDVAIPSPPPILLKLDTFHLYVLGDSVAWGQGNNEESKHYALLAAWLTKRFYNALGVYVTVLARSGAPIFKSGSGPFTGALNWPPEAAEIPADRPFITEQAGTLVKDVLAHGSLSTVKLVLLTACANDVDANTFWCPR
ncbi:TPA: hypothetical protein ACH3X1_012619 [Trebouxia sp. C0004]